MGRLLVSRQLAPRRLRPTCLVADRSTLLGAYRPCRSPVLAVTWLRRWTPVVPAPGPTLAAGSGDMEIRATQDEHLEVARPPRRRRVVDRRRCPARLRVRGVGVDHSLREPPDQHRPGTDPDGHHRIPFDDRGTRPLPGPTGHFHDAPLLHRADDHPTAGATDDHDAPRTDAADHRPAGDQTRTAEPGDPGAHPARDRPRQGPGAKDRVQPRPVRPRMDRRRRRGRRAQRLRHPQRHPAAGPLRHHLQGRHPRLRRADGDPARPLHRQDDLLPTWADHQHRGADRPRRGALRRLAEGGPAAQTRRNAATSPTTRSSSSRSTGPPTPPRATATRPPGSRPTRPSAAAT